MRVNWREAAVIASPVDRTRITDAGFAGDRNAFIEVKADDNVRGAGVTAMFGLNQTHGKSPRDWAVSVADEDSAKLRAALQTCYRGKDRLGIAITNEQIVTASIRSDHDGACGYRP